MRKNKKLLKLYKSISYEKNFVNTNLFSIKVNTLRLPICVGIDNIDNYINLFSLDISVSVSFYYNQPRKFLNKLQQFIEYAHQQQKHFNSFYK